MQVGILLKICVLELECYIRAATECLPPLANRMESDKDVNKACIFPAINKTQHSK